MTYGFVRMRATLGDSALPAKRNCCSLPVYHHHHHHHLPPPRAIKPDGTTSCQTTLFFLFFRSHAFHLSVQLSFPLSPPSFQVRELKFAARRFDLVTDRNEKRERKERREADRYLWCAFDESRNTRAGRVNGSRRRDDPLLLSPVNRYRITGHWMFGRSYGEPVSVGPISGTDLTFASSQPFYSFLSTRIRRRCLTCSMSFASMSFPGEISDAFLFPFLFWTNLIIKSREQSRFFEKFSRPFVSLNFIFFQESLLFYPARNPSTTGVSRSTILFSRREL